MHDTELRLHQMSSEDLVNPTLYRQLVKRFASRGGVKVVNPGARDVLQWEPVWDARTGTTQTRLRVKRDGATHSVGEQYATNCPFCGDTRHRLMISHLWDGRFDSTTKHNYAVHANCWNEDCLRDLDNRDNLYSLVWGDQPVEQPGLEVHFPIISTDEGGPVELPQGFTLLQDLPRHHNAIRYLQSRGFNTIWLGQNLGVGYTLRPELRYRYATDRIIIPMYDTKGELAGWQARSIGDPRGGMPKYITCKGTPRAKLLYNLHFAICCDYLLVVEGPLDCWRYGPEAVAAFGKVITAAQADLLRMAARPIVVLLDGDVSEQDEARAVQRLGNTQHTLLRLPDGKDPADFSRKEIRKFVESNINL